MTPCDFCALNPADGTMTRQGPEGTFQMRLCSRCMQLHQFVVRLAATEHQMGGRMCLKCGRTAEAEGTAHDREGRFLGRFAICHACANSLGTLGTELLVRATPWSPGIIELPPLNQRPFLPPLQGAPAVPSLRPVQPPTTPRIQAPPLVADPLADLRRELDAAVQAEDYMRAAELRDEIRRREDGR